jgi:hypothetical protein
VLDPRDGQVGSEVLTLPDSVSDIAFSPNESRVIFRTGRWLHRSLLTPAGLVWTDSIRSPKSIGGSRMVLDGGDAAGQGGNQSGDRILVLSRVTGAAELVELHFSYSEGPALFGSRPELLRDWTERLKGPAPTGFLPEGR